MEDIVRDTITELIEIAVKLTHSRKREDHIFDEVEYAKLETKLFVHMKEMIEDKEYDDGL